jgi:hypothetical protein
MFVVIDTIGVFSADLGRLLMRAPAQSRPSGRAAE